MNSTKQNLFVLTGGPGSGKTTLLDALDAAGFATAPEAGRSIIRQQKAMGGSGLPSADRLLYAELMLSWDIRSFQAAPDETAFFDRGIPDTIGYLSLCGIAVPAHFHRAAEMFRYNRTVFILPPWPDIFRNDTERTQSPEEAEATFRAMQETYTALGYRLVEVPRTRLRERLAFVLAAAGVGDHPCPDKKKGADNRGPRP
ncbi:AAA family ATPase [Nitratireductor thuwali]|uniref:NadR/Ttd14 AAA domain-containing protein n=1 Tax=Nitratireductor thuwali TaxID=2267699 RepID=A0ABY5MFS6_9HYPH|nr:hypothetical protein NTH_00546 [Nitratireductor thuwali]